MVSFINPPVKKSELRERYKKLLKDYSNMINISKIKT